jgi:chromosome segregation ATPase
MLTSTPTGVTAMAQDHDWHQWRGSVDHRLDTLDTRLGKVETRLDSVETRLEKVETRLEHVETRLGRVEVAIERLSEIVQSVREGLAEVKVDGRWTRRIMAGMFALHVATTAAVLRGAMG